MEGQRTSSLRRGVILQPCESEELASVVAVEGKRQQVRGLGTSVMSPDGKRQRETYRGTHLKEEVAADDLDPVYVVQPKSRQALDQQRPISHHQLRRLLRHRGPEARQGAVEDQDPAVEHLKKERGPLSLTT